MERINKTVGTYVQITTFLLIWLLFLVATDVFGTKDVLGAIFQIPKSIAIYLVINFVVVKWLWRLSFLQGWLIKIPNLQGTWEGDLISDWVNPETKKGVDSIRVKLVIEQDLYKMKCTLMTEESTSTSIAADIDSFYGDGSLYLSYTYTNRPRATLLHQSEIHDGAAILKVIQKPDIKLEGSYWTSRKTRGDMQLSFKSKHLSESFAE